jgi:hypothetical protein
MDFKVLGRIWNVETIAVGNAIREIRRLRGVYGPGTLAETQGDCEGTASERGDPAR